MDPRLEFRQEAPKKPLETGKKVFAFLSKTKFLEIRKNDTKFEEWMASISFEDFMLYLSRLNGILREVQIEKRSIDGGRSIIFDYDQTDQIKYLPPAASEKGNLIRDVFYSLRNITNQEDRALLFYYALVAIHPYADGNGRTARLIHELLSEEGKELTESKLSQLLDHDEKGGKGVGEGRYIFSRKVLEPESAFYYINRELVKDVLGEDFLSEFAKIYYFGFSDRGDGFKNIKSKKGNLALAKKFLSEDGIDNFPFRGIAVAKFLQEKGTLSQFNSDIFRTTGEKEVVPEDVGKKILTIDADEFESSMTPKDLLRFIKICMDIKNRFIAVMIDIFKNPDAHVLKSKSARIYKVKEIFRVDKYM
jgi:hypothetical protein